MKDTDPLIPELPEGSMLLFSSLRRSKNLEFLTQDLVAVKRADGKFIDVSWWPEFEANGSYIVTLFSGSWENLEYEKETDSADEAIRIVEALAKGVEL